MEGEDYAFEWTKSTILLKRRPNRELIHYLWNKHYVVKTDVPSIPQFEIMDRNHRLVSEVYLDDLPPRPGPFTIKPEKGLERTLELLERGYSLSSHSLDSNQRKGFALYIIKLHRHKYGWGDDIHASIMRMFNTL